MSVEVLLRKPLDIILHWQKDLIWSYSDVSGWISLLSSLEGLGFFRTADHSNIVRLSVHLQLTHAKPSSLGSVGGSGGLIERVHLQETKLHVHSRSAIIKTGDYL